MREDIEKTRQRIRSLEFDISQLEERKQDCLLRLKLRDLEIAIPSGRVEVSRGALDRKADFEVYDLCDELDRMIADKQDIIEKCKRALSTYERRLSESD